MNKDNELKDFLDKSIKKTSYFNRILSIITVSALLIGIYALLSRQNNLINKNEQLITQTDSLKIQTDSLKKKATNFFKEDSLKSIVYSILDTKKNEETIKKYYAPVLQRYYLDTNITIEQSISKWRNNVQGKNLKYQKVSFGNSDIEISYSSVDTTPNATILVKTSYTQDSLRISPTETIYQIKIDSNYKIYSLRNLLPKRT